MVQGPREEFELECRKSGDHLSCRCGVSRMWRWGGRWRRRVNVGCGSPCSRPQMQLKTGWRLIVGYNERSGWYCGGVRDQVVQ